MLKKLSIVGAALAMTATAVIPVAPAMAQTRSYRGDYNRSYGNRYNNRYYNTRTYRGRDQRYRAYQKCKDGDGGAIVGAIAGGLLGNSIAGRGDKTLGTIIGGLGGALAGRAIDRSDRPNYCR
jgi:uncharacterized protein YcfJ